MSYLVIQRLQNLFKFKPPSEDFYHGAYLRLKYFIEICSEHGLGYEEHERVECALRLHCAGAQQARLERALHHPDILPRHR